MKLPSSESLKNLDSFFLRINSLNTRSMLAISMFQLDCCDEEVITRLLSDYLFEYRDTVLDFVIYMESLGIK